MAAEYAEPAGAAGCGGYLIAELPDRERPRERLLHSGAEALSDTELLAILLRSGPRGRSVLDLARELIAAFGNDLARLAAATVPELRRIRGIGLAKAAEVRAAFALAQRLSCRVGSGTPRIESPAEVAALMREVLRLKRQEEFHVLLLNTKHQVLRDELITVGLLDRSQVHSREVFRRAIAESCSRIILVHNHPSGDPTPSPQDIACTRDLVNAGKVVGIEVLDHVVIGRRTAERQVDFVSFRQQHLL
jgi:DNA repair protein RadC